MFSRQIENNVTGPGNAYTAAACAAASDDKRDAVLNRMFQHLLEFSLDRNTWNQHLATSEVVRPRIG